MKKPHLSKSRITIGLQCPKRLYLEVHRPELKEEDPSANRLFTMGDEVGEVARGLYPQGILIEHDTQLSEALKETESLISANPDIPLFEATFSHQGVLIRADVLQQGDLIEVKSSTSVKDYQLIDCTIQAWVLQGVGYDVQSVHLAHVNNEFIYKTENDYQGLLTHQDVTEEIQARIDQVAGWVENCQTILMEPMPEIAVGKHCNDPFACPFAGYCTPPQSDYPVTTLPRGRKVAEELIEEGIVDIRDIPHDRLSNPKHEWIRQTVINGQPYLDPEVASVMQEISYPRYYLDFETIQFAVPIWLGTRPYQQLPFQWSCHFETKDGELAHEEFLDVSGETPMRACAQSLIKTLNKDGPILVYNEGFEKMIMRTLGELMPEYKADMDGFIDRVVDLLPIAREYYYHPDMHGSWSIKKVLPTIAPELDYSQLEEVQDGGAAQTAYLEAIHPDTSPERKESLKGNMLKYCELDTLAMVEIAHYFSQYSNQKIVKVKI